MITDDMDGKFWILNVKMKFSGDGYFYFTHWWIKQNEFLKISIWRTKTKNSNFQKLHHSRIIIRCNFDLVNTARWFTIQTFCFSLLKIKHVNLWIIHLKTKRLVGNDWFTDRCKIIKHMKKWNMWHENDDDGSKNKLFHKMQRGLNF